MATLQTYLHLFITRYQRTFSYIIPTLIYPDFINIEYINKQGKLNIILYKTMANTIYMMLVSY